MPKGCSCQTSTILCQVPRATLGLWSFKSGWLTWQWKKWSFLCFQGLLSRCTFVAPSNWPSSSSQIMNRVDSMVLRSLLYLPCSCNSIIQRSGVVIPIRKARPPTRLLPPAPLGKWLGKHNPSSTSWVSLFGSTNLDMPRTPPEGEFQDFE